MKILLAVDGSAYTTKAVDFVISHFDWFQGTPQLHLLHVQPPFPDKHAKAVVGRQAIENYYKEESEAALAPAEDLLRKHGVAFERAYLVGDIAAEIQEFVRKHGIDMVVMGSHGHGSLKSLIMGSTTSKVLAATNVPVLLIR
jgi:nucleotide-binding universal stress UspA family protein